MRVNEDAIDLVLWLYNEVVDYHKEHGNIDNFKYLCASVNGLKCLFDGSNLPQKYSFEEFLVFIHLSLLQCKYDRYVRVAGLAYFITRIRDIGFTNARAQLAEENQDFIKTNLLKIELI